MATNRETRPSDSNAGADGADPRTDKGAARLLVVDDSMTVRMSLRDLLVQHGYTVLLADDGEAALKLLRSERIDVLMLDLVMPGGDGRGLLKEIKADEKLSSIPIILLTAVSNAGEIAECRDLGVDDFISKPWDESELLARLRTIAHLKDTAARPAEASDPAASTSEEASQTAGGAPAQNAAADLPAKSEAGESPAGGGTESSVEAQAEKRPRVLVVDDSMVICMRLTEELHAGGMDAIVTDKPRDALARVRREKFDLAITDVVMPGMDGEELIQRLGKLAPQLPCVVLTGSAEMALVRRLARAPNVAGILVKPWERVRLMETLKSALERRAAEPIEAGS